MPLRLEIISNQRERLGERRLKEFGVKGGTIGRSLESDWALEDSKRYLSGRHAAIDFRSGTYYIIDTSTNGVYVNDSGTPIGRTKPQRLFHGDRLRLGEYIMQVHLDDDADLQEDLEEKPHVDPVNQAQLAEKATPTGYTLVAEDELSASEDELRALAIEEILADDTAADALKAAAEEAAAKLRLADDPTNPPRPKPPTPKKSTRTDDGAAASASRPAEPTAAGEKHGTVPRPDAARHDATSRHARTQKLGPKPPAARNAEPATRRTDARAGETGVAAFLRGAGLSARELSTKESALLLHRAGQLVRELTIGLRKSIDVRVEQKNSLRLANTTIQPRNNNLLKFAASVDEALKNLFFMHKPEYLPALDAVREAFDEIETHERALLDATHAALLDYLERLDPEEIEQKCRDGKRGLLGTRSEARYWDRYAEVYAALAEHAPGHFPQLFAEILAEAYDREIERRANPTPAKPTPRSEAG